MAQPVDEVTRASAKLAQHLERQVKAIAPEKKAIPALILKPTNDLIKAVACILEGAARFIRKCGVAAHNRCPWVSYVNQAGGVCSQFLKRSLFTGYHFQFKNGLAVVTNLETGAQYTVSLEPRFCCTCQAFQFSPLPKQPCKHIEMMAEILGRSLEQTILPEYVGIDEQDLPKGCFLQRTEDCLSREFYVFAHIISRVNGVPTRTTKCIGRLLEGLSGIQTYRLHSGVYSSFSRTLDAAKYLVSSSDYCLKEIAKAFDVWDELALEQYLDIESGIAFVSG